MKRATMTFPDDLAEALENYVQSQEAPPSLTTVVQAALRQYLGERGFLRVRRNFEITPSSHGSGHIDVSQEHDRYLVKAERDVRK
jgi:metal-responsive CopG/Arc/MetJ family transcriptional regulator